MHSIKYIFIILLFHAGLFAQTTLSAKDAVFKALENNFQVQIADLQSEIAGKNNSWGGAGAFPSVTLTVGNNNVIQDNTNNPLTFTPGIILSRNLAPSLAVNWNIFSGFAVHINKARLEQLEEQSANNATAVIESTVQDVLKAYYSAQLQREQLDLLRTISGQSREIYTYYKLKEKYSTSTSLESLQYRNQYLTDSMNYLMQEISYQNAIRNLKLLMNDTLDVSYELTDPLNTELGLIDREQMKAELIERNANLQNQLINVELQHTNTNLQRSFMYPTLSMSLGTNPSWSWIELLQDNPTAPFDKIETNNLTYFGNLSLRYTIYDNWRNKRAVEISKIQEEIAQMNYEDSKRKLTSTLDNLIDLYMVRNQMLSVSEENLDSAKKAYDLAKTRYELGTINSIDLAAFQTNYRNAMMRHYENLYNRLDTFLEIYRLTGKIGLEYEQQ